MKAAIIEIINDLKVIVRNNLNDIQNNQKAIRYWLKQSESEQKSAELEEKYAINKILLNENNDYINIQLTLTSFLEKYKDSNIIENDPSHVSKKIMTEEECFELTVNGQLSYNSQHPYYNNKKFFDRLLNYFQRIEDYENCNKLVLSQNH
jgi:hypothetical protein